MGKLRNINFKRLVYLLAVNLLLVGINLFLTFYLFPIVIIKSADAFFAGFFLFIFFLVIHMVILVVISIRNNSAIYLIIALMLFLLLLTWLYITGNGYDVNLPDLRKLTPTVKG